MIFNLFNTPEPKSPEEIIGSDPRIDEFIDSELTSSSLDTGDANDFTTSLLKAVQAGNLDPSKANLLINSRVAPNNSDFFTGDTFNELANFQLSKDRATGLIGDAFQTNFFRGGTQAERDELFAQARDAGVLNDANELNQFLNRRLARSPEGEAKRPFDANQLRLAAYYGAPVRDEEGRNTSQFDIYGGDKEKYEAFNKRSKGASKFIENYLTKMGAKS